MPVNKNPFLIGLKPDEVANALLQGGFKDDGTIGGRPRRKRQKLDGMSSDQKMARRKLKNRVAAQSARDRKKEKMTLLEEGVVELQDQNTALRKENAQLKSRTAFLERELALLRRRLGSDSTSTFDTDPTVTSSNLASGVQAVTAVASRKTTCSTKVIPSSVMEASFESAELINVSQPKSQEVEVTSTEMSEVVDESRVSLPFGNSPLSPRCDEEVNVDDLEVTSEVEVVSSTNKRQTKSTGSTKQSLALLLLLLRTMGSLTYFTDAPNLYSKKTKAMKIKAHRLASLVARIKSQLQLNLIKRTVQVSHHSTARKLPKSPVWKSRPLAPSLTSA